ncbi:G-box-binding factor 1-like protein [Gossypium australe]|uniref:G-box-binding factor 1-like protein n=1 Tax=Gossypium australe TaxID=47621 RepID=A0A5B6V4G7_9ROSI|nr:G-box-binding factor 1-like protein [Gossypium australe]
MELGRGSLSSSCASPTADAAADRMDMEAAEILAALAHSKKRVAVSVSAEFGAKWGCKGRRLRKRASTSTESPPSGVGSNPVQSGSDLAEDQATTGQEQSQVMSTSVVIESVVAESLIASHPCAERYPSDGVVRSSQNVTKAEKETCRLRRMLTRKDSDWQMIHERQILFSTVGIPEKDIWEDSQLNEMTGNNALIKPVKTEQNAESVRSSPAGAIKHVSGGGGRSRQNLTEAEKEARRLRRILANRESARQTIRRRQVIDLLHVQFCLLLALCEKLTLKVTDLTQENENLKRINTRVGFLVVIEFMLILHGNLFTFDYIPTEKAKELALKEYHSQDSTNKHLKAEMAKALKADEGKTTAELQLDHHISGPSGNYPYFFYNQHHFLPFCWPSSVQSSHPVQSQCGQNAIFVPSSISSPANGRLDSSFNQENPINVNGPKTALYVVPYPWVFSLPDQRSGLHPQPSCGTKDIEDETSVSNHFNAGCHLKPVMNEKFNSSLPVEVEKEAYDPVEASPNNKNCTSVRLPAEVGGQCMSHIKEEVLVPGPLCSAGTTFENRTDHVVKTEEAPIGAFHFVGALPEENKESKNYTSKKVLDAVAAAEARKRRKELTKLKNLHGRHRSPLSLSAKI